MDTSWARARSALTRPGSGLAEIKSKLKSQDQTKARHAQDLDISSQSLRFSCMTFFFICCAFFSICLHSVQYSVILTFWSTPSSCLARTMPKKKKKSPSMNNKFRSPPCWEQLCGFYGLRSHKKKHKVLDKRNAMCVPFVVTRHSAAVSGKCKQRKQNNYIAQYFCSQQPNISNGIVISNGILKI